MKPFLIAVLFFILSSLFSKAQNLDTIAVKYVIEDGDTVPVIELNEISLVASYLTNTPEDAKKLAKLARMVKKVYPYAKLAGIRFQQMNDQLAAAPDRRARKKIIQTVEDEINKKYGDELKKLTFSQGKILIKLIDRETKNSTYDVVREFKGSFMAFFYQSFAKIWGFNLRTKYDPEGEDKDIELIIQLIEKGQI
ncbi:MAG: DUF4294 domain-containing protein [Bacteroidales bacterium]